MFLFLGKKFNNPFLIQICDEAYSSNSIKSFSINPKIISFISSKDFKRLNNFSININNKKYGINRSLISVVSDKIFNNIQEIPTTDSFNLEYLNVTESEMEEFFKLIYKYLKGESISFSKISESTLSELIASIGLSNFQPFIKNDNNIPSNHDEAMLFLQCKNPSTFEEIYLQCINVVSSHFSEFSEKDFLCLNIEIMEKIVSCPVFHVQNETYLLEMIMKLMKYDKNYSILLKYVLFCFVDFSICSKFFSKFDEIEVDIELFDSIVESICQPAKYFYSSKRWEDNIRLERDDYYNNINEILKEFFNSLKFIGTVYFRSFVDQHLFYQEYISNLETENSKLKEQLYQQNQFEKNIINSINSLREDLKEQISKVVSKEEDNNHTLETIKNLNDKLSPQLSSFENNINNKLENSKTESSKELQQASQEIIKYSSTNFQSHFDSVLKQMEDNHSISNERIQFLLFSQKIPFSSNDPAIGIFSFLKSRNIDFYSIIELSASSTEYKDIKNILTSSKAGWRSEDKPNSFINFTFKNFLISISGYSLKLWYNPKNSHTPLSWVIKGLNEEKKWIEIDIQNNVQPKSEGYFYHHIPCNKLSICSSIRLEQTGLNSLNKNNLSICSIEFYGRFQFT
jgi:hypothetical protein